MADYKLTEHSLMPKSQLNAHIDMLRKNKKFASDRTNENIIEGAFKILGVTEANTYTIFKQINKIYGDAEPMPGVATLAEEFFSDPLGVSNKTDSILKEVFKDFWKDFTGQLKVGASDTWDFIARDVLGFDREKLDTFLGKVQSMGLIDEESKKAIGNLINTFPKGEIWIVIATILSLFKTFIAVYMSATGGTLMKKLNSEHTPNTPDPGSVIRAAFLDESLSPEVRRVMAENGLDKKDQDLMFISQYATLDPDTVRQLYLRGFIDETHMIHRLRELGYTPERIKEATQLFDVLPPIQDIATMMAKEAFEPQQVALMGLEQELPGEFVKYAGQHGYSKEWATKYWIMHWQQPGLELMFRAYHRRLIDEDALKVFMKTIEIPPYLRDVMIGVAYTPLTRVDVRRMYEDGVIDVDQVYSAYLDHGYSPDNATLMTQWTVRYAEPNEKELSRAQITDLYIDGHITRDDAQLMLTKLGYPEHRASLLITYAEYKEIKDEIDEAVDNIKIYFQNNLITKDEARQRLNQLDVPQNRISILIERWNIKNITDTKLPSKTDLDKFYRKEIIDDSEYKAEMRRLGYSNKYIGWYLANLRETT